MQPSAIAVITEQTQNDVIAALHAAGVGHLTRVIRQERGRIVDQLRRAGVDTSRIPTPVVEADRVVLVTPAPRAIETASLVLQRGATSAWMVTAEAEWEAVDDRLIEIAATRELPARPVPPAHRSGRTFRKPNVRRRPRHGVSTPNRSSGAGDSTST